MRLGAVKRLVGAVEQRFMRRQGWVCRNADIGSERDTDADSHLQGSRSAGQDKSCLADQFAEPLGCNLSRAASGLGHDHQEFFTPDTGEHVRFGDGLFQQLGEVYQNSVARSMPKPVVDQFDAQSRPLYASSRLWDDGVIDPRDTRDVLGLSLSISLNAPIPETRFGVFRM